MEQVENPMVIDSLWDNGKPQPKVIGVCEGCQEEIYEGEPVYDFQGCDAEGVLFHQKVDCCFQYVSEMSVCKIAGE